MSSGCAANGSAGARTVDEWLAEAPGYEDLAALLRPIALAVLNEDPREGSATLFARVLDRLLSAPAAGSGLALPRRGLGDLLAAVTVNRGDHELDIVLISSKDGSRIHGVPVPVRFSAS